MRVALALLALLMVVDAGAADRVRGYTRRDGTYVAPHYRSSPDSSTLNNYSTKSNINPYTGQTGTQEPMRLRTPSPSYVAPRAPCTRITGANGELSRRFWLALRRRHRSPRCDLEPVPQLRHIGPATGCSKSSGMGCAACRRIPDWSPRGTQSTWVRIRCHRAPARRALW